MDFLKLLEENCGRHMKRSVAEVEQLMNATTTEKEKFMSRYRQRNIYTVDRLIDALLNDGECSFLDPKDFTRCPDQLSFFKGVEEKTKILKDYATFNL